MQTAKLFPNGKSQAVRLPKAFRFEGEEVFIRRMGNSVILLPKSQPWACLREAAALFTDDFLADRSQPDAPDARESL